jgi:hypothetical protein
MVPYFLHQGRDDNDSSGTDIISLMNHWVDRLARDSTKGSERNKLRYQFMKRLISHIKHEVCRVVLAAESGSIDFDPSYELLFAATYNGDLELVDQLSQDTRRIREDAKSGLFEDRLIEAAVKSLDPKIVEMLLRRGARMHPEDSDEKSWDSPVVLAVETGVRRYSNSSCSPSSVSGPLAWRISAQLSRRCARIGQKLWRRYWTVTPHRYLNRAIF